MLIVWTFTEAVLKQKKGITAVPKRGTDGDHITYTQTLTHTHTHTHTQSLIPHTHPTPLYYPS